MARKNLFQDWEVSLIKDLRLKNVQYKEISKLYLPHRPQGSIEAIAKRFRIASDKPKNWSKEEDEIILGLASQDLDCDYSSLVPLFHNRTASSIKQRFAKLNLTKPFFHNKYNYDESFWKQKNPTTACIAGFIAADGCVLDGKSGNDCMLCVSLQERDEQYMKTILSAMGSNATVSTIKEKYKKFSIWAPKWKDDLVSIWGITPRKTFTLKPPQDLDRLLMDCYLAGFLDGDGGVSVHKNLLSINAVGAVPEIMELFLEMSKRFPHKSQNKNRERKIRVSMGKYYRFACGGFPAIQMAHYLMSLPCPHLERKYNKVRNYLLANPKYNLSLPPYEEKLAQLATAR